MIPFSRHNQLCYFISNVVMIMEYCLAGNDQPQTNQPNGQASD